MNDREPKSPPHFSGRASSPDYRDYLEGTCMKNPQVLIELTSICNFHCFYCVSADSPRKTNMRDEIFYRALDQIRGLTTQSIRVHCDGEPTLHKKFYEYAKALNDRGHRVALASNGSALKEKYLELSMDVEIHLSTSADEFARRSKISFERYLDGMRRYARAWREGDWDQNLTYKVFLSRPQRRSTKELKRTREVVNELLRFVGFAEAVADDKGPNAQWLEARTRRGGRFRIKAVNITSGGMYPETEQTKKVVLDRGFGFCDSPWKRLVVLADGRVQACCLDLYGSLAYTDPNEILEKPLREIWEDHAGIAKMREQFLSGRAGHETCRKCLDRLPSRELYTGKGGVRSSSTPD